MIFSGKAESKSIPLYWHSYIAYYTESRPVIVNIGVNVNAKTLSGIKEINELRIFFWQVFKHSWRLYIASCQHHARVAVREMRHLHGGTTTPYMVKRSVDGRQDRAFSVFLLKLCWVKNKKMVFGESLQLVLKTTLLVSHHIKKTRYLLQCVLLQLRSAFFPDSAQSTQTFTELFTLLAHASAGRGVGEARCLCLWLTRTLHAPGKSIQPCIHEQYLHAGRLWLVNVPSRLT